MDRIFDEGDVTVGLDAEGCYRLRQRHLGTWKFTPDLLPAVIAIAEDAGPECAGGTTLAMVELQGQLEDAEEVSAGLRIALEARKDEIAKLQDEGDELRADLEAARGGGSDGETGGAFTPKAGAFTEIDVVGSGIDRPDDD